MIKRLATIHLWVGSATVVVFLYTGYYMRVHFPAFYQPNEVIRYLFRASHIYILFSGLLNLAIGAYFNPGREKWKRVLQMAGSGFLMIAPFILLRSFFTEPMHASPERPLALLGVVLTLTGTIFHGISGAKAERL